MDDNTPKKKKLDMDRMSRCRMIDFGLYALEDNIDILPPASTMYYQAKKRESGQPRNERNVSLSLSRIFQRIFAATEVGVMHCILPLVDRDPLVTAQSSKIVMDLGYDVWIAKDLLYISWNLDPEVKDLYMRKLGREDI